jgi:DNA replication and repair protein RecF
VGERGRAQVELEVVLRAGEGKQAQLNGAPLRVAEQLRRELATLVFTPDRLAVVKGAPAVRRAYFDRALGRLAPARSSLPAEYAAAVGQRNAALRRVAGGLSTAAALVPWTVRVADLGAELVEARREVLGSLAPAFNAQAGALGLLEADLIYDPQSPSVEALEARLGRDLERGSTGLGPHLDEIGIVSAGRDLRSFGSQGEQRLTVLALLLAEADLIEERRGFPPLLLLDDVLSELDGDRRRTLAERIGGRGQALVTSTTAAALPGAPAQLLEIRPGSARAA